MADVCFDYSGGHNFKVQSLKDIDKTYNKFERSQVYENKLIVPGINLKPKNEHLLILSANEEN